MTDEKNTEKNHGKGSSDFNMLSTLKGNLIEELSRAV